MPRTWTSSTPPRSRSSLPSARRTRRTCARWNAASLLKVIMAGFINMKALGVRPDEPARASRPFDRDRNGFVIGEGSGIMILEDLERAMARGARIYCEVVGYGSGNDAYH